MKILLIGKNGQVGWELQRSLSTLGDVVAVDYFDKELCGDLTNLDGIAQTVRTVRPDVVVNAAAHTAVDKAESERELSDLLNDKGVAVLAAESAKLGALMVHYSTDYVFDGAGSHYRREDEATGPLNVYGETKRAGELALEQGNPRHLIFRTSWCMPPAAPTLPKPCSAWRVRKRRSPSLTTSTGRPPAQSCWQTARRRQSVKRCVIRRWPVPIIWWPAARPAGATTPAMCLRWRERTVQSWRFRK